MFEAVLRFSFRVWRLILLNQTIREILFPQLSRKPLDVIISEWADLFPRNVFSRNYRVDVRCLLHRVCQKMIFFKFLFLLLFLLLFKCQSNFEPRVTFGSLSAVWSPNEIGLSCMGAYYVLNTYYVLYFTYNTLHTYRAKQD